MKCISSVARFFFEFKAMIFWKTKIEYFSFSKPSFPFPTIRKLVFGWFGIEYCKGIVLSACVTVSLLVITAVSRNCYSTVIWTFFFLNFVFSKRKKRCPQAAASWSGETLWEIARWKIHIWIFVGKPKLENRSWKAEVGKQKQKLE